MADSLSKRQAAWQLARVRARAVRARPGDIVSCAGFQVQINDGPNYYTLYKTIFDQKIYHFDANRPDPRILDCGSNIGLSILYYKHIYPQSQVVGFEPDPLIWPYLQHNLSRNQLAGVQTLQAAVSPRSGTLTFASDGKYSGFLEAVGGEPAPLDWTRYQVPCVRLGSYLTDPVDFLKLNIEGAEYEVLADAGPQLRQVSELVVEYHHLPGLPRTLHLILALLHEHGFEYLINDLDAETNAAVEPPFRLRPDTGYFLLIYARRINP
ncbi:MAG: FkbM family methyltransferase [Anaerolineales bacterium]|nr:FkbM family methyltransferase [Anaerolineales bacterium]